MGFNPSTIDPRNIQIFGNEGGMLPQNNSFSRPDDLKENAIFVTGESDGKFSSGDYVLFYGLGPDRVKFNTNKKIYAYERNLYSDKNFYFVTVGTNPGLRLSTSLNQSGTYPDIDKYSDY